MLDEIIEGIQVAGERHTAEMRVFATTYQHLVGDGMNIAVAMAGLPNAISAVLNDKILTFLNRAHKVDLTPLQIADVSACYAKALRDLEIEFDAKMLEAAARATGGYPYLFQLVGYHMLKFLHPLPRAVSSGRNLMAATKRCERIFGSKAQIFLR